MGSLIMDGPQWPRPGLLGPGSQSEPDLLCCGCWRKYGSSGLAIQEFNCPVALAGNGIHTLLFSELPEFNPPTELCPGSVYLLGLRTVQLNIGLCIFWKYFSAFRELFVCFGQSCVNLTAWCVCWKRFKNPPTPPTPVSHLVYFLNTCRCPRHHSVPEASPSFSASITWKHLWELHPCSRDKHFLVVHSRTLGELPDSVCSVFPPNRLTESKPSCHLSLLVFDFYVFVIILSLLWSFCPSVVYCVSVVA